MEGDNPIFLSPFEVLHLNPTAFARYRSTATLISLMLETGFQSPHKMIDAYVEAFTDFQPTDGKPWIDLEPDFPNHFQMENVVTRLKFEKMSESPYLL